MSERESLHTIDQESLEVSFIYDLEEEPLFGRTVGSLVLDKCGRDHMEEVSINE